MRSKEKREAEKNEARNASANKKAAAPQPKRTSKVGVFCFAAAIFVLFSLMGTALVSWLRVYLPGRASRALVSALLGTIRLESQISGNVSLFSGWENITGRLALVCTLSSPIIEYAAAHVDQRIITTPFIAEEAHGRFGSAGY